MARPSCRPSSSDQKAVMMSINPGSDTAGFAIDPEILAEIAEAAKAAAGA